MRNLAKVGVVVVGTLACTAETRTSPSEPAIDTPEPQNGELVLGEYVGEVDVKGRMTIRPALPHEQTPGLAARSWSRISGSGTPAPTINVATGTTVKTAAGVSGTAIDATAPAGFSGPTPATDTCGGTNAAQCGYVWISQAATNAVPLRQPVAVIYNVSNNVKLTNTEALPDSDPSSDYSGALPVSGSPRYFVRYGGSSWATTSWSTTAATSVGRPWKWDLGSPAAAGFTFSMQLWAVVDRTDYSAKFATDTTPTFFDACTASSGGTVTTVYDSATNALSLSSSCSSTTDCGYKSVTLPFPFSVYDYGKSAGKGPATSVNFWVDGALTFNSASDAALPGTTQAVALYAAGTPDYGVYPYRSDLALVSTSKMCVQTNGTAPARSISFTWKDARFLNNAGVVTSSAFAANFTARLYENSDRIEFQYGTVTNNGSIAVGGVRRDNTAASSQSYVCLLYNGASGNCKDLTSNSADFASKSFSLTPSATAYKGP